MAGAKTGVATRINKIELHAHFTHCHGHTLSLAVSDNINVIKIMRGSIDAAFKLNKLIKYSIITERAFNRLREDTPPQNSADRTLCSDHCIFKRALLQSTLDTWAVLQELWGGISDGKIESKIQGQVIGVQTQMQSFNIFLEIELGVLVLMHTSNLSS